MQGVQLHLCRRKSTTCLDHMKRCTQRLPVAAGHPIRVHRKATPAQPQAPPPKKRIVIDTPTTSNDSDTDTDTGPLDKKIHRESQVGPAKTGHPAADRLL